MDFTSQYQQFAGGQPYGHFMPVPPLTPSHSHSANSDDFNRSPPQDTFDHAAIQPGNFQSIDYSQAFNAPQQAQQHPAYIGPPTPPNQGLFGSQQQHIPHAQQQQLFQQQQQQQQQPQQHTVQQQKHSPLSSAASNGPHDVVTKTDPYADDKAANGSNGSDDDENATPAQSRRKAQNRAAQRAFRERKERHVKDLETKLADLESAQQHATNENQRLKAEMQKMSTENEILRATGGAAPNSSRSPEPISTGPMTYQPVDFYHGLLRGHANQTPSHRITVSDEGEKLLGAAATWEYIINHESFKRGMVNIGDVSESLNHRAKCDGQGPVFAESTILDAIQQSVTSGSDDLL